MEITYKNRWTSTGINGKVDRVDGENLLAWLVRKDLKANSGEKIAMERYCVPNYLFANSPKYGTKA
jgi:hypothetical protein